MWSAERMVGLLAVARAVPLLQVTGCPVAEAVNSLVEAGDPGRDGVAHEEMRRFYDNADGHDNDLPDYLQCQIVRAAMELARPDPDEEKASRIVFSGIGEAWGNCDYVVEREQAGREPIFRTLKTTLVGVELNWQERDRSAIGRGAGDGRPAGVAGQSPELVAAYRQRLAVIREPARWERRRATCHRIAELAAWRPAGPPSR